MTNKTYAEVIKQHQKSYPVNVKAIAEDLGINVYNGEIGHTTSGKIVKDDNSESGYSIYTNSKESEKRQRFTIAHELAHFMLHKDMIGDGITENTLYRNGFSDSVERDANRLAADILMPFDLINKIKEEGEKNIPVFAKKLNVSEIAFKIQVGIPVVD